MVFKAVKESSAEMRLQTNELTKTDHQIIEIHTATNTNHD